MLKERYFVKKLEVFNNFLQLLLIFSAISVVCMKVFLFNNRKSVNGLDYMIANMQREEQFLKLELNLLTNPRRLEELYNQLQDKHFADSETLDYRQIKDLNNLYPYFYSKKETLKLDKIVARR
jgi:cell division protein FtsL